MRHASMMLCGSRGTATLVVLNLTTGAFNLHPVRITIFCNKSYQAQIYVAWVALHSRTQCIGIPRRELDFFRFLVIHRCFGEQK